MHDTPVGVTTFPGQVQGIAFGIKNHPTFSELGNGIGTARYRGPNHLRVAQAGTRVQGIGNMRFEAVLRVSNRGHAALCPMGRSACDIALAQHGHPGMLGQSQGSGETGGTAADDQNVRIKSLRHGAHCRKQG